jgi:HK97 family phage major capsid protein
MARPAEDIKSLIGQPLRQSFTFDDGLSRAADATGLVDEEKRTVSLVLTTDRPIFHGFAYIKLDHSPECIRLDRLKTSAPLLENHDPDRRLGRLRDPETDGQVLRALARFNKRPLGEEIFQEVRDDLAAGDFTPTSSVFIVHKFAPKAEGEIDGYPVYRAVLWEPIEGSIVSAQADLGAGVGRAMSTDDEQERAHDPESCDVEGCPECAAAAAEEEGRQAPIEPATVVETRAANTTPKETVMEPKEEILQLAALLDRGVDGQPMTALAREFVAGDKTLDEFKAEALKRMRANQPQVQPGQSPVELTPDEKQRYSIGRAILLAADGGNGFEREVSDTIGKKLGRSPQNNNSIFVPTGIPLHKPELYRDFLRLQRTPLTTGGATTGADILFTQEGTFIDLLRATAKVITLGARMLPGLTGAVAFPKQTGAGTLYWVGENPGSDVTESNIALDQVVLAPKTAMAQQSYSRQLLRQSAGVVDNLVTDDLRQTAALGIDRAAVHGAGGNEPTGVYNASGVSPVAFGGAITFPKVVQMETEVASDNADVGRMGYLTTPGVRGAAKTTQKFSGTNGEAIWTGNANNGEMNGYRAEVTTQVRSNMGAGSDEHGIAFGAWDQLIIGEWGTMEILTDPYTLAGKGLIRLVLFLMVDMALRHPEAFSKGTGLTVS